MQRPGSNPYPFFFWFYLLKRQPATKKSILQELSLYLTVFSRNHLSWYLGRGHWTVLFVEPGAIIRNFCAGSFEYTE